MIFIYIKKKNIKKKKKRTINKIVYKYITKNNNYKKKL